MILAGDIGGTHTRLGIFDENADRPQAIRTAEFLSQEHAGLAEIVQQFLSGANEKIAISCFGVAGPVVEGRSQPTNINWTLDQSALSETLGFPVILINDLQANAYGIATLGPTDFATLQVGKPELGNAAVISAGTGLGEAGMYWDGGRHRPFPTEGGHSSFAPSNPLEIELLKYLQKQHGHVSWERILSGPGLVNVYNFWRDTSGASELPSLAQKLTGHDAAAVISDAGVKSESPLCIQALDIFVSCYGSEAGNLALKTMAINGVYIGGGIAPHILAKLQAGPFIEAFCAKGRLLETMRNIPVHVILNDRTALFGAARCAALALQPRSGA